jgi:hypothetical protein
MTSLMYTLIMAAQLLYLAGAPGLVAVIADHYLHRLSWFR